MKTEKMHQIIESYINGNIGETKKAVKAMSKLDMLDMFEAMRGYYGMQTHDIVAKLRGLLS